MFFFGIPHNMYQPVSSKIFPLLSMMKPLTIIIDIITINTIVIMVIMIRIVNVSLHWPLAVSATQMPPTQTPFALLMRGNFCSLDVR